MKKINIVLIVLLIISVELSAQKTKDMPRYFGETFKIDSIETLLLTVQYNSDLYSGKFSFTEYYGNLIFYNYVENTQKKLFEKDTYIKPFRDISYYYRYNYQPQKKLPKNISNGRIFLFVYNVDFDGNKKITGTDPAILYTCNFKGEDLKVITPKTENAISFELFNKQGFMLIKMQRDYNNDKDFTYKDKDYYYLKVDLSNFTTLSKIELK